MSSSSISAATAATGIAIAVAVNTVAKSLMAIVLGASPLSIPVSVVSGAALIAGIGVYFLV